MAISNEKIIEAKQKLGQHAAEIMAQEIPIEEWDPIKLRGKSVFREENTPSMIWFSEGCCFKDFGSGLTMDYIDYLRKYKNYSFVEAIKELFELIEEPLSEDEFKNNLQNTYKFDSNYVFPHDELPNDRAIVEEYCARRGLSPSTLDFCDIKQNAQGNMAFQFKDTEGRLVCVKYRLARAVTRQYKDEKWRWQKPASNCPLLYGVNRIDLNKPLLITEGMNDRVACVEAGFLNAVSIPGGALDFNWIEFNYDFLNNFSTIIIWSDDDEPGKKMQKECVSRLGEYRTRIVTVTEEVKNQVREFFDGKSDKCDANNVLVACGPDVVRRLIQDAKEVENPRLKDLFSYEEKELADMPYTSTGIKALDKVIWGNFEGDFIVLTGNAGGGKSSLVSIMGIIAPLESGKNVFVYSGEFDGGKLLGNFYHPLAGRNHIIVQPNKSGTNGYKVTSQAKLAIRDFYKGRIRNFDDVRGLNSEGYSILKDMEYCYRRYNTRFFVIDNLMTIDTTAGTTDEKYSSQITFTKDLKDFTRRYPVTVILVAHPRKPSQGEKEVGLYGIAGASEIINLADRGFSIRKLPDDDPGADCEIRILKDRHTGQMDKRVRLMFDPASARIFSDTTELHQKYSWERMCSIEYPEDVKKKILGDVPEDCPLW